MTLKLIKKLCTPAYVYLVISVISIIVLMFQNSGNTDKYCMGSFTCPVNNTSLVFFIEFLYVAFWTFVLDTICKAGYKKSKLHKLYTGVLNSMDIYMSKEIKV